MKIRGWVKPEYLLPAWVTLKIKISLKLHQVCLGGCRSGTENAVTCHGPQHIYDGLAWWPLWCLVMGLILLVDFHKNTHPSLGTFKAQWEAKTITYLNLFTLMSCLQLLGKIMYNFISSIMQWLSQSVFFFSEASYPCVFMCPNILSTIYLFQYRNKYWF